MVMALKTVVGAHENDWKMIGTVRNLKKNQDHSDNPIVEIGQNTEKSPGYMRRIIVTQTSVKAYELTLMWKTHKELNRNKNDFYDMIQHILK